MPVLVRIAFRNLLEHKSKSLIIGLIIAIGIMILVIGNSFINTAALGIRRAFIDNFTGDVMVSAKFDGQISLFGAQSIGGMERTPTIPSYDKVIRYINSQSEVAATTSQVSGFGAIGIQNNNDVSTDVFTLLFGIDASSYHAMFDNVKLTAGSFLAPGQTGILLSTKRVEAIDKQFNMKLKVGDSILLNSFSNAGFRIRVVPVRGIFEFRQNTGALEAISYVDVQTLRALLGMVLDATAATKLDASSTSLLGANDADLFGGDMIQHDSAAATTNNVAKLSDTLAATAGATPAAEQVDTGAWNFILIKLKNPAKAPVFMAGLQKWFDQSGIAAQPQDWKKAADGFASSSDVIRVVFDVAILIVAIVAIIIIMNTLVISVIERTPEIGTMRALGAQRGFIWRMFMVETLTVTTIFGIIGIILGAAAVGVVNLIGIHVTNEFLQVLFAGSVLRPSVSIGSLFSSLVVVIIVGLLAHLYPVSVALKVQPVKAIQTE
ncbi:MAG TPA: FtsX-like permease family protein [Spirochaetia bacterium]|nr:FtsX-like permease family protein [Spirochaetia bacterium]